MKSDKFNWKDINPKWMWVSIAIIISSIAFSDIFVNLARYDYEIKKIEIEKMSEKFCERLDKFNSAIGE